MREQVGLSKTQLAKPRYTGSYVSQIEAGRKRPSAQALAFFAHRFGVTVGFLATGVPTGIEHSLRYQLEEARRAARDAEFARAEHTARSVMEDASRFQLGRIRGLAASILGDVWARGGRIREAIDCYEDALSEELPGLEEGLTVAALGRAYRTVGDLGYAAEVIESYLARTRSIPLLPDVTAELSTTLGSIYFERGDSVRADRAAQQALAAAEGASPEVRANTFWYASRVVAEAKRWDEALELATRARLLVEQLDDRRRLARLHNASAFICLEADPPRTEEAEAHLDAAESLLAAFGAHGDLAYVLTERSRLALLRDRPLDALMYAERAQSEAGADELEVARCLFLQGRSLGALGRRDEAEAALQEAAAAFEKLGARQQQAAAWRELGYLQYSSGNLHEAVAALFAGLDALDPRRSRP